MSPERDESLEEKCRRVVIAVAIIEGHSKNPNLSLKHSLCRENPEIRKEVEAILRSLNGKKENSQDTCDKI
jgi:hypothetical protein